MTSADPARTPLVDVHAHFLTGHYVQAAKDAGILHPDGGPGWLTWGAARHLELMDQWGIATSILSISSPGVCFGDLSPPARWPGTSTTPERRSAAPTPADSGTSPPCRCPTSTRP